MFDPGPYACAGDSAVFLAEIATALSGDSGRISAVYNAYMRPFPFQDY
jgi:hypothetical protein